MLWVHMAEPDSLNQLFSDWSESTLTSNQAGPNLSEECVGPTVCRNRWGLLYLSVPRGPFSDNLSLPGSCQCTVQMFSWTVASSFVMILLMTYCFVTDYTVGLFSSSLLLLPPLQWSSPVITCWFTAPVPSVHLPIVGLFVGIFTSTLLPEKLLPVFNLSPFSDALLSAPCLAL